MRKTAAQAFYLAVFGIFSRDCRGARAASSTSASNSPDVCALEPKAKVSDACASYADLDELNERLHPYVHNLASNTDFFAYYRLNLYSKKCPFWSDENGLCGNIACAVTTLDNENEIPEIWRAEELSKLEGPKAQHPGRKQQHERQRPLLGELGDSVGESCVVEYDDECDERDYCVPEDESASSKGDYVSLNDNPERFTGYSGEGAHQVWEAIYRENCFSTPRSTGETADTQSRAGSLFGRPQNRAQASLDLKQVMKAHGREQARRSGGVEEAVDIEDECLEKRVFYRVISGMHASISTHLCHDYLNQTTGEWAPNLQCYKDRLHNHPERVSNLYFNYALVLRAVGKLHDYVQDYTFCTGDAAQDGRTKRMLSSLALAIPSGPRIFDERAMFTDRTAGGLSLKDDFRNRFRNVSRIMDCVGCDKCRLWGKIQTNGLGTALKVLFEFDEEGGDGDDQPPPLLRRTELVALINTLDKISAALQALEKFRAALAAERAADAPPPAPAPADEVPPSSPQQPSHPPPSSIRASLADLDELDDFDDDDAADAAAPPGFMQILTSELHLVVETSWFVVVSWARLPRVLASVLSGEVTRLYDFWLGREVQPRGWEIRWSAERDEL